jgi:hypothetical protein
VRLQRLAPSGFDPALRADAAARVKKTLANAREREAYNCSSKLIENESVTARGHSRTQYAREKRNVL